MGEIIEEGKTNSSLDVSLSPRIYLALEHWPINSNLTVLNEVEKRLALIKVIRKLWETKTVDEEIVMHSFIAENKWLFGSEYDSIEYVSSEKIRKTVQKVFKDVALDQSNIPYLDQIGLMFLANATLCVTGLLDYSSDIEGERVSHLLIIELLNHGVELTKDMRNQTQGYVEDMLHSSLGVDCQVTAIFVGDSVAENLEPIKVGERGRLMVTNYSQLFDRAEKRMLGVKINISTRKWY